MRTITAQLLAFTFLIWTSITPAQIASAERSHEAEKQREEARREAKKKD